MKKKIFKYLWVNKMYFICAILFIHSLGAHLLLRTETYISSNCFNSLIDLEKIIRIKNEKEKVVSSNKYLSLIKEVENLDKVIKKLEIEYEKYDDDIKRLRELNLNPNIINNTDKQRVMNHVVHETKMLQYQNEDKRIRIIKKRNELVKEANNLFDYTK